MNFYVILNVPACSFIWWIAASTEAETQLKTFMPLNEELKAYNPEIAARPQVIAAK